MFLSLSKILNSLPLLTPKFKILPVLSLSLHKWKLSSYDKPFIFHVYNVVVSLFKFFYKIIQIVCVLWLAIKPFYMCVCKHSFHFSFISWKPLRFALWFPTLISCSPNLPRVYIRLYKHGNHFTFLHSHFFPIFLLYRMIYKYKPVKITLR